jgi:hypothetical protein
MPTLVTGAAGQVFDMYSGDSIDITVDFQPPLDTTGLVLWWGMGGIVKSSVDPAQIEMGEAVVIHVLPEDTVGLSGGYKQQLRSVDGSGRVATLAYATMRVTESVFQPPGVMVQPIRLRQAA